MRFQRNKRAFSLVELLIVIGIIAVLFALALPGIRKAMASAQGARCIKNAQQLAHAFIAFRTENNGQVVPYELAGNSYHPGSAIDKYLDVTPRAGYAISKVWGCPANPPYLFPPDPNASDAAVSYLLNAHLIDQTNRKGVSVGTIQSPTKCLLLIEKVTSKYWQTAIWPNDIRITKMGYYQHAGGGNTVAFVDGHIEQLLRTHPAMEGGTTQLDYGPYWYPGGYP